MPRPVAAMVVAVVALGGAAVTLAVGTGTIGGDTPDRVPDRLALVDDRSPPATGTIERVPGSPLRRRGDPAARTVGEQTPLGAPGQPFAPLPGADGVRVVVSSSGVAMPVVETRDAEWLVSSACLSIMPVATDAGLTAVTGAHVVLDPGHGGAEPGAVSPGGLVEKDLNLTVARETARLLTEAGATVVLTRDGDHTMTVAARGLVARSLRPALLVSIHHNGGAPPGDGGPGTIVFTGAASPESTRFGGLFHETLEPLLLQAEADADERHEAWLATVDAYDEARAAHHRSVAERDAALVANGQVPATATTAMPPTTTVGAGELRVPTPVELVPTTTAPPTASTPVPVPDTLAPPAVPEGEPVPAFRWAGSGNAGVRAWVRPDGLDYLGVLRNGGGTPSALVEFPYLTNPSEEALLADPAFLDAQATVLADAVTRFLSGEQGGTGFVADQTGDQPIGGGGSRSACVEPALD